MGAQVNSEGRGTHFMKGAWHSLLIIDGCLCSLCTLSYLDHCRNSLECKKCTCISCFLREIYKILLQFYLFILISEGCPAYFKMGAWHPGHCSKLTGAYAPVVPVLTEALVWTPFFIVYRNYIILCTKIWSLLFFLDKELNFSWKINWTWRHNLRFFWPIVQWDYTKSSLFWNQ